MEVVKVLLEKKVGEFCLCTFTVAQANNATGYLVPSSGPPIQSHTVRDIDLRQIRRLIVRGRFRGRRAQYG